MISIGASAARAWLPPDAKPPAALQAMLAGVIEAWSGHWFAGTPMRLAPLARGRDGDLAWRGLNVGILLGTNPDTATAIGARMLDVPAEDRAGCDRALLEEVAEACLADLRNRLAQLAGVPSDAWRPVVNEAVWTAMVGRTLAVGLSNSMFATLVTRGLPSVSTIPLRPGAVALAGLRVMVSAAVGRADLTVAELRTLDIGDVIVLDRALTDNLAIAVDGHPLGRGRVRVVPADPVPLLEIVDAAA